MREAVCRSYAGREYQTGKNYSNSRNLEHAQAIIRRIKFETGEQVVSARLSAPHKVLVPILVASHRALV